MYDPALSFLIHQLNWIPPPFMSASVASSNFFGSFGRKAALAWGWGKGLMGPITNVVMCCKYVQLLLSLFLMAKWLTNGGTFGVHDFRNQWGTVWGHWYIYITFFYRCIINHKLFFLFLRQYPRLAIQEECFVSLLLTVFDMFFLDAHRCLFDHRFHHPGRCLFEFDDGLLTKSYQPQVPISTTMSYPILPCAMSLCRCLDSCRQRIRWPPAGDSNQLFSEGDSRSTSSGDKSPLLVASVNMHWNSIHLGLMDQYYMFYLYPYPSRTSRSIIYNHGSSILYQYIIYIHI